MSWWHGLGARLSLLRGRAADSRIQQEIGFHIDMETERLVRDERLEPTEARRRAILAFGAVESHRESLRDGRGLAWLGGLTLDLKLGLRMLRKYPGLTIVAVIGIGMAVAFATVIFAAFDIATRPSLPLPDGDRIVGIRSWDTGANAAIPTPAQDFFAYEDGLASFGDLAAFRMGQRNLIFPDSTAKPVYVAEVTASAFRATRVPPMLGRYLLDEDERPGATPVAVIGYDLWRTHFGSDPSIVGRRLRLGTEERTIAGVMPDGYEFPVAHELWVPLRVDQLALDVDRPAIHVFGRLATGASREAASAELAALAPRLSRSDLPLGQVQPRIVPFPALVGQLEEGFRRSDLLSIDGLFMLLMAVICVDVATLVYARTAMRHAEIAVRAALGASRSRLVGQLVAEALVLSAVGTAMGVAVAAVVFRLVRTVLGGAGEMVPFWFRPQLSPAGLMYVVGLTVLATIIIGVLPARTAATQAVRTALAQLSGGTTARLGKAWTVLIVAQVGIAVAVLPAIVVQAGSYGWYSFTRPGFPAREYLTAQLQLDDPFRRTGDSPPRANVLQRVKTELEREPGVRAVTFSTATPGQEPPVDFELDEPGRHVRLWRGPAGCCAGVRMGAVAANFFDTFDVPLVAGRAFASADAGSAAPGVIVNQSFVREALGGGNAIGHRIRRIDDNGTATIIGRVDGRPDGVRGDTPDEPPWSEIIGVVPDFPPNRMNSEISEARVYELLDPSAPHSELLLSARVPSGPGVLSRRLQQVSVAVDPGIQLQQIMTLDAAYTTGARRSARLVALMMTLVTLSVLVLSAAGIYSLMSFTVTRRRREIGIRSALGANPRRLLASVFAGALRQLGIGCAVGLVIALLLSRSGGEYVGAYGPIVLPAVIGLMLFTGTLAAVGPARRGLRISPADALKSD